MLIIQFIAITISLIGYIISLKDNVKKYCWLLWIFSNLIIAIINFYYGIYVIMALSIFQGTFAGINFYKERTTRC